MLEILKMEKRISSSEIDAILRKNNVRGNPKALQHAYRLRVGQQFLSTLRDKSGKREVLATSGRIGKGHDYLVIEACNDHAMLKRLQHKLHASATGLHKTAIKVDQRVHAIGAFDPAYRAHPRPRRVTVRDFLAAYFPIDLLAEREDFE